MEQEKKSQTTAEQMTDRDLSEQIKKVTMEIHTRAEKTELMMSFMRGQVTLAQYKLLLCSLYEVYQTLEEEMDRNSNHPGVAPIYFPTELARLDAIAKDLEYFYGRDWREKIVVPAATKRYCHRLRQIGKENPEFLVAHAYTRYLGDLSGGQVLGRIAQKSMGLKGSEGLSFFAFPGPDEQRGADGGGEERHAGGGCQGVRVKHSGFDDLQKMLLTVPEKKLQTGSTQSVNTLQIPIGKIAPLFRMVMGLFVALATVSIGLYAY
ncbi:Heme oxygenase [Dissostichus eleginoides]|uniref:heme oxygenase (biliverdin-producing) n=1 Tax=Dissostichus eleginoides TaxID=100907 RepID=A0AAD9BQ44_DISEL|nr:Heme oxygenase [Dissostichus eleginoides]